MCTFVIATLPADADLAMAGQIFSAHKLGFEVIANKSLLAQLPAGERCILTTKGHCDCGTPLGAGRRPVEAQDHHRELEKLRKRGWSQARLTKWLEQKEAYRARSNAQREARNDAHSMDIEKWIAFIQSALGAAGRIGLLIHEYGGGIAAEQLIVTRTSVPAARLDKEVLLTMKRDIVYEMTR